MELNDKFSAIVSQETIISEAREIEISLEHYIDQLVGHCDAVMDEHGSWGSVEHRGAQGNKMEDVMTLWEESEYQEFLFARKIHVTINMNILVWSYLDDTYFAVEWIMHDVDGDVMLSSLDILNVMRVGDERKIGFRSITVEGAVAPGLYEVVDDDDSYSVGLGSYSDSEVIGGKAIPDKLLREFTLDEAQQLGGYMDFLHEVIAYETAKYD